MWDEPDVKDVNKNSLGSFSYSEMSMVDMAACGQRLKKAVARAVEHTEVWRVEQCFGKVCMSYTRACYGRVDVCRRMPRSSRSSRVEGRDTTP